METYRLKKAFFKSLKGLKNICITFEKDLTAIMGVNGSGKTTVIHALACAYQPPEKGNGENYKFSDFLSQTQIRYGLGALLSLSMTNQELIL